MDTAAIRRLLEEPPRNSRMIFAVAVFCLLAGTVAVTNTGEPFSLDQETGVLPRW